MEARGTHAAGAESPVSLQEGARYCLNGSSHLLMKKRFCNKGGAMSRVSEEGLFPVPATAFKVCTTWHGVSSSLES